MKPCVSICMPVYEAAAHLQETLDSVWAQEFEDFELIAVDDGSRDGTGEILAAQTDPRLRLYRHPHNLGQARTVAETIARADTDLVKFLDSDDLLRHDCVGRMVAALDSAPTASFAFARRRILAEQPDDPATRRWIEELGELQVHFGELGEVNDGRLLLRRYLEALLPGNWVAEPAGVMARRADLVAVGGYNPRVVQANDVDLWVRLMTRGEVVFIDEPLYTYRLSFTGVTGSTVDRELFWLDRLWIATGLEEMEDAPELELIRRARRRLQVRALKRTALAPLHEPRLAVSRGADLVAYARHRLCRRIGRAAPLQVPIAID